MGGDIIGVIISILFVGLILLAAELIRKAGNYSNEFTRKFVHIGVAHWWLIAMLLIDNIFLALIPPIIFLFLNYYSYKKDLFKSMEREEEGKDLGTVFFPMTLIVLILLTWDGGLLGNDMKYLGAIGVLIMGYGDGFAAIIGGKCGRIKYKVFNNVSSLLGSITVLVFSFLVSIIILGIKFGLDLQIFQISFAIAVLATLIEAFTPRGFDNLTVPIISTLAAYFFFYIINGLPAFTFILYASIGFILSFIIAYVAHTRNSLSTSGCLGAILLGTFTYAAAGFFGFSMMILFFLSSSLISSFKKTKKERVAKQFDKTGQRDLLQVFANGGVGLIHAFLFLFTSNPIFLICLATSYAAANADTWATELGILNKKDPYSLRGFKRVDKGTSGAVSLLGTAASLAGSMIIGLFATIGFVLLNNVELTLSYFTLFLLVSLGGFIGALVDSVLGATVQGIYYSDDRQKETERKEHNGKPNRLIRGYAIINNDVVNFTSIAIASVILIGFM